MTGGVGSCVDESGLDVSPASEVTAGVCGAPPIAGGNGSSAPLPPLAIEEPEADPEIPEVESAGVLAESEAWGGARSDPDALGVVTAAEVELEALGAWLSLPVGGAATTGALLCSLFEGASWLPELDPVEHAGNANISAASTTNARGDGSVSVRRSAREGMMRMTVVVTLRGNAECAAPIACTARCEH